MYLRSLYTEDNGPLRALSLDLPFNTDGTPKPVVLVGGNGSGKTNLLSMIADALFEAAAKYYTDVFPGMSAVHRPWFRVVGASTVSVGAPGSFSILNFEHNGSTYFFKEKTGDIPVSAARLRIPPGLQAAVKWSASDSIKDFAIGREQARKVFEEAVHVYFPSSRAEIPHWLNRESIPETGFDLQPSISKRLRKPIYVERGLEPLKQWLLSVLVDTRMDFALVPSSPDGQFSISVLGDPRTALTHKGLWHLVDRILKAILCDDGARIVWLGRRNPGRLAVAVGNQLAVPSLDALSAGQATLLNIFGTLIRYGDASLTSGTVTANRIAGICLIDEVDAHMHIDLQHRTLPTLIKMFPHVQFIMSTHSPLFVLGMERKFDAGGVAVVDMPSGKAIDAEAYSEFGRALEVVRETKAFTKAVTAAAATPGKLLVLVEGETDPVYYRTAAELLGRNDLLEDLEIDWVGAKDPKGGQGFNTGSKGLDSTLVALRANPDLMARPVLLVYDNDTNKPTLTEGKLYVRRVPGDPQNKRFKAGIECLLPDEVFTEDMIQERKELKRNGTEIVTREVQKMRLCKYLCEVRRDPADFHGFTPLLDTLETICAAARESFDRAHTELTQ